MSLSLFLSLSLAAPTLQRLLAAPSQTSAVGASALFQKPQRSSARADGALEPDRGFADCHGTANNSSMLRMSGSGWR